MPTRRVHAPAVCATRVGELVGYVAARTESTPAEEILRPRTFVVVDMLAVRSDRRRRGVGRSLMGAVHGWASERRLGHISLDVWEFNESALKLLPGARLPECQSPDGSARCLTHRRRPSFTDSLICEPAITARRIRARLSQGRVSDGGPALACEPDHDLTTSPADDLSQQGQRSRTKRPR
jgi:acetyltransferase (GNAT) family protein